MGREIGARSSFVWMLYLNAYASVRKFVCYPYVVSKRPYRQSGNIIIAISSRMKERHCCRPVSSAALFLPHRPIPLYTARFAHLFFALFFHSRAYFLIHICFSYNSQSTLFITHKLYVHFFPVLFLLLLLFTVPKPSRANETEKRNPTSHFFLQRQGEGVLFYDLWQWKSYDIF